MSLARHLLLASLLLLAPCLLGCGGDSDSKPLDMGGADGDKISSLIEELNEAVGNPKKLDTMFVKGSKPADAKKMSKCSFSISGKPSVSGSTGTAKVRIDPASGGQTLGEPEWAFEKNGDTWKIKSAPLP